MSAEDQRHRGRPAASLALAVFFMAFAIYAGVALVRLLKEHVFGGVVSALSVGPVVLAAVVIWSVSRALRAWRDWRRPPDPNRGSAARMVVYQFGLVASAVRVC